MVLELVGMSGLLGVVVAKIFSTKGIQVLKRQVADAQSVNNKIKGELKITESKRAAASQDLNKEERKLRTLKLKAKKQEKDIASFKK